MFLPRILCYFVTHTKLFYSCAISSMQRSVRRIAVAMSGGVDSSVAALILKRRGKSVAVKPDSENKWKKTLNDVFFIHHSHCTWQRWSWIIWNMKLLRKPHQCCTPSVVCANNASFTSQLRTRLLFSPPIIKQSHEASIAHTSYNSFACFDVLLIGSKTQWFSGSTSGTWISLTGYYYAVISCACREVQSCNWLKFNIPNVSYFGC